MGLDENYVIDKTPEYIWRCLNKHDYFMENYEEKYEYSRGDEIEYIDYDQKIIITHCMDRSRKDFHKITSVFQKNLYAI